MKYYHRLVCIACLTFTVALPLHADRAAESPESRLTRLPGTLNLSAQQRAVILEAFRVEHDALTAVAAASSETDPLKRFRIRQETRAAIYAALSPEQRRIYEDVPTSQGGGRTIHPEARVKRLDAEVMLTPAQAALALEIFTEEAEALREIPPKLRMVQGREARESAKQQIHALLTPEQRAKQEARRRAEDEKAAAQLHFLDKSLRSSVELQQRVGAIAASNLKSGQSSQGQDGTSRGAHRFEVTGTRQTVDVTVHWRCGHDGAYELTKLEIGTRSP